MFQKSFYCCTVLNCTIVVPEKTPCDAKAKTLLAPNSFRTSAALHSVPAVSTMSSTEKHGMEGGRCVCEREREGGAGGGGKGIVKWLVDEGQRQRCTITLVLCVVSRILF